jgi:hypothetical protein
MNKSNIQNVEVDEKEQQRSIERFVIERMSRFFIKSDKIVNRQSIAKVFEYVGGVSPTEFTEDYFKDLDILSKVLAETKFSIRFVKHDYYFPEDKDTRDIYRITVERNGRKISFKFGASLQMSYNGEKPELYDILTSIQSDYSLGMEGFEEFCSILDKDTDSISALKSWKKLDKYVKKLDTIFNETEIWSFPH